MSRIIAIINQKGGSGKTTTSVNVGAYLAKFGRTVLLIDLDPQSNSTIHLGLKPHEIEMSVYDVMMYDKPFSEVIRQTEVDNLFAAPANINLSGAEIELAGTMGREMALRDAVERIENHYDYILIDCPLRLGFLQLML